MFRRRLYLAIPLMLVAVVMVLGACAPAAALQTATPVQAPAAATAAPAPTNAPAASGPITLQIAQNDKLGKFLADGAGKTLYLFTKDTRDTSNCYDKCATAWPPLISDSAPSSKDGVTSALIGSTTRKDGSKQVTYNGWSLYYFAADKDASDTKGQAVGKVWWVVSGEGNPIKPAALKLGQNDKLGKFLVDDAGRTVYMFTKDSKDTSVCYDKCEQAWPPLLSQGAPTLDSALQSSLIGQTTRKDGTTQVTYNGMPLYYYTPDLAPGDVKGQGVGNVWYVVDADGKVVK